MQQEVRTLSWLNTLQAADYVGLAKSTLEKARLTGAGPQFGKLGRSVRYRQQDLDRWIENRLVSSTSEVRPRR